LTFPAATFQSRGFGITFGDPTPADLYPTDIYTLEYDGFADFPQYPINPIADLNAFAGDDLRAPHLPWAWTPIRFRMLCPLDTVGDTPHQLLHDSRRRTFRYWIRYG